MKLFIDVAHMLDVVFVMFVCFVYLNIFLPTALDPALVGLSMFYAMLVSGIVQFTIRTSALVENLVSYFFLDYQ